MTVSTQQDTEALFSEVELPESCPSCAGALAVRFFDGGAWGVCLPCGAFSQFDVEQDGREVALTPLAQAEA